ncbi:MAG: NAD-binding protein, partial [Kiritimatiellaeota bacterium]|nr:NAD-binding protein [Kiritimatiellota bacterium]
MNVIIAGAGNAGRKLAEHMRGSRFSITMLDVGQEALETSAESLDVMTVRGSAADPAALEKAGVREADLFVALTDKEETNVLACILAKHAGATRTIAKLTGDQYRALNVGRVSDPAVNRGQVGDFKPIGLSHIGVDFAINQKAAVAEEVYRSLALPGAMESFDLFEGRAVAAGFPVEAGSPLAGLTPAEFPDRELLGRMRVVATWRGGGAGGPRGGTG